MSKDKEKIISDLKTLGFVYAIAPSMRRADAVCILGATKPKMANRMQYLEFYLIMDSRLIRLSYFQANVLLP